MSRIGRLRELFENDPNDVFLNFGLAIELLEEDHKEEAIAQLDRVLNLDPSYVAAHVRKGTALSGRGLNRS